MECRGIDWGRPVRVMGPVVVPGEMTGISVHVVARERSDSHEGGKPTFDAVVQLTSQPYLVLVNSALPVKSVQELVAHAEQSPNGLYYGLFDTGSVIHLGVELLGAIAGMKLTYVPYKGIDPAVNDAVAGHIQMLFANGIAAASAIRGGLLRALAVTSRSRTRLFPDLPTVAESGISGFELDNMYALYTPVGVLVAILARFRPVPDRQFPGDPGEPHGRRGGVRAALYSRRVQGALSAGDRQMVEVHQGLGHQVGPGSGAKRTVQRVKESSWTL